MAIDRMTADAVAVNAWLVKGTILVRAKHRLDHVELRERHRPILLELAGPAKTASASGLQGTAFRPPATPRTSQPGHVHPHRRRRRAAASRHAIARALIATCRAS